MGSGFQLFGVHGADDSGQDGELGQGLVFSEGVGILDLLADLSGEGFDGGDSVDLLGGLDVVSLVSNEERQEGGLRGLVQLGFGLVELFTAAAAS